MQWVATFVDNTSGPANAASSSVLVFSKSLTGASVASAKLDSSTAMSATRMRGLHGELGKAQAELARFEAAAKRMQGGASVNVADWKKLQGEITKSKTRVTDLNSQIVKGGGAGFDTKAYDDKQKKSQDERSKTLTAGAAKNAATMRMVGAAAGVAAGAALAVGAVGLAAFISVGQRALSSQIGAQSRLNAITARYNQGLIDISKNANLTPFLNSADKLAAMFDKNTATGKFMGVQVKRAFDAVGSAVTAVTPYAEKAFAKMLLASIRAEIGFWKVVKAGAQIGANVTKAISGSSVAVLVLKAALSGVGLAAEVVNSNLAAIGFAAATLGVGLLGSALISTAGSAIAFGVAFAASNPLLLATSAAVLGVVAAITQLQELLKTWDENSLTQISNKLKADLGLVSEAEAAAATDARQGSTPDKDYDKKYKLGAFAETAKQDAANDGKGIGSDIGKGIVAGLDAEKAAIAAAGAGASDAALTGAKTKAKIKSPSRAARDEVGKQIGAGVELGIKDKAGAIQSEAERSLVPNFGGIGGGEVGTSVGSRSGKVYHFDFRGANFGGTQTESDIEEIFLRVAGKHLALDDMEAAQ